MKQVLLIALLAVALSEAESREALVVVSAPAVSKERAMEIDHLLERAAAGRDREYLDAERAMRELGPAAADELRRHLHSPEPMTRLTAQCLLGWIEGRAQDYQAALDYLDSLPARIARTPLSNPPPVGVAAYLSQHFGPRVADLLALRLAQASSWPHWRVMGVLFYLRAQAVSSTTPALVRFAATSDKEEHLTATLDAVRAAWHPGLGQEIEAEKRRAERLQRAFPAALAAMGGAVGE